MRSTCRAVEGEDEHRQREREGGGKREGDDGGAKDRDRGEPAVREKRKQEGTRGAEERLGVGEGEKRRGGKKEGREREARERESCGREAV